MTSRGEASAGAFWRAMAMAGAIVAGAACVAMGSTYHVATDGSDDADGLSPETAWATLEKVNAAELEPGDSVLFRRGDTWRGSLSAQSGSEEGHITYGAYGEGRKPVLMGSVSRSDPGDWTYEGGNVWATGGSAETMAPEAPERGTEPAIEWHFHTEGGAKATHDQPLDPSPSAVRVTCEVPGWRGNQIQLYCTGLSIEEGRAYRLVFRARGTKGFSLGMPGLMSSGPPWTAYSRGPSLRSHDVRDEWRTYIQYYQAAATAHDARLTLYLGGGLPAGATFELDSFLFETCDPEDIPDGGTLPVDVGNIIFGDEESCGVKVWEREHLEKQDQYWYDEGRQSLHVYSESNPAERHGRVECALKQHIINEGGVSYAIYENLALRYGAAHGIGGGSTHHIIARDLDISYIGGSDQMGGSRTVRFGNGIEFWGNAHDNLVERCRIWEIYDAALTNQGNGSMGEEYNITYRNNIIWNSEYSFEYWNRPENAKTWNVQFINNTCLNAGHGWGHAQRPDPSGRHLCFYTSPAQGRDIIIRNNIFFEAAKNAFYAPGWPGESMAALVMDHNLWYQAEGQMIALKDRSYTMAQFGEYQTREQMEANSRVGPPALVDPDGGDFRLSPSSPCIDAGMPADIDWDFAGNPVPFGRAPDIGALEYIGD